MKNDQSLGGNYQRNLSEPYQQHPQFLQSPKIPQSSPVLPNPSVVFNNANPQQYPPNPQNIYSPQSSGITQSNISTSIHVSPYPESPSSPLISTTKQALLNEFTNLYRISKPFHMTIGVENEEEYPSTISKFWIKIDCMKKLYPFNKVFIANVDKLMHENKIRAWKRSRGDGNCYFRAVISTYFDFINKPWQNVESLKQFRDILEKSLLSYGDYKDYEAAKTNVLAKVKQNITLIESGRAFEAYESCIKLLQNESFDLNLIMCARYVTACTLLECKDEEDIFPYVIDGCDAIINDIMSMGKEGGEMSLLLLPRCLGIQVVQYMYLDDIMSIQCFPYEVSSEAIIIRIVRRAGHYDILYTFQEQEIDQCNIAQGSFTFYDNEKYYQILKEINRLK